jgi:hypothetical protein
MIQIKSRGFVCKAICRFIVTGEELLFFYGEDFAFLEFFLLFGILFVEVNFHEDFA